MTEGPLFSVTARDVRIVAVWFVLLIALSFADSWLGHPAGFLGLAFGVAWSAGRWSTR